MSNAFYAKGAEKILSGSINFAADTIKVMLVKNDYVQNLATDEFVAGISSHRVGADQPLTAKTVAGGIFDAADIVFPAVATGPICEAVVIYKDTGNEATSPLIAYIDSITSFPVTTNGGDIDVNWDNGTYKILSLV